MPESKSGALPLGDIPMLARRPSAGHTEHYNMLCTVWQSFFANFAVSDLLSSPMAAPEDWDLKPSPFCAIITANPESGGTFMNIQDWTLYYDNFGPLSCQAPCTMYSVLYDHGKSPTPSTAQMSGSCNIWPKRTASLNPSFPPRPLCSRGNISSWYFMGLTPSAIFT